MGDSLPDYLGFFIHELLRDRLAHEYLAIYNHMIFAFYATGKRQDMTSYQIIYDTLWNETELFIESMEGIDVGLGYPSTADPQALGKRTKSIDGNNGDPADQMRM